MARLEAIAKALFYPTQPRVVSAICKLLRAPTFTDYGSTVKVLDPCAGEGHFAAAIAEAVGGEAYGVELHTERAAVAASVMKVCLSGSYQQLRTNMKFGVLALNPPYDAGVELDGAAVRQEEQFLRGTLDYLDTNGVLVYIVPRRVALSASVSKLLRDKFTDVVLLDYPEPEASEFGQCVVIARRSEHHYYSVQILERGDLLASADEGVNRFIAQATPAVSEVTARETKPVFRLSRKPPPAPSFDAPDGAYAQSKFATLCDFRTATAEPVLVTPRLGHQAMLLAAGALNGLEVGGSVLKGGSAKHTYAIKNADGSTTDREVFVSHMSALDLTTGEYDRWNVAEESDKTAKWFRDHAAAIRAAILEDDCPQVTQSMVDNTDVTCVRAPGVLPGKSEPELLPPQKIAGVAIARRWRTHKAAVLSGEMGIGKTVSAILAAELARAKKVIVVCPTHLVRKWVREVEIATRCAGNAKIAKRISDIDDFFDSPVRYLILSKETAKLGAKWRPASAIQRKLSKQVTGWGDERTVEFEKVECPTCPSCGASVTVTSDGRSKCKPCGSPLWQATAISDKGTKRWPLARYINDRYKRRYTLVIDECHAFAKGDTDQSRAVQHLCSGARKILAMTGTLYGGRASSLFHLLYKVEPSFREMYEVTECAKFVEHFGLFESTYPAQEQTSVYGYRRGGKDNARIKEIPGMSPAMIPLLLPFTIFAKLADLEIALPPYTEKVQLLDADPRVASAMSDLAVSMKAEARENPRSIGAYLQTSLGWPDCPFNDETIYAVNDEGEKSDVLIHIPAVDDASCEKDDFIVDLVAEERAQDRKVLVYFSQTGRRDSRMRVKAKLEAAGLTVAVLESSVSPEKREDWVRAAQAKGFDVMLTNGRLVETGLDLLFANTIVQYGMEYSLSTLRQSLRRSWRLGQTKPVRVIFLAYASTFQEQAADLVARKMRAAELIEGDDAGGIAAFDQQSGDFMVELANEVLRDAH